MSWKKTLKRVWHFIWEDNSIWSWLVNIALAFVLIKFIVYPSLGFLLITTHPVVAVVSESMEHNAHPTCAEMSQYYFFGKKDYCSKYAYALCGKAFSKSMSFSLGEYWNECGKWYESNNITIEQFTQFSFKNGFNTGDIMVLRGKKPEAIKVGDIIVFWSSKSEPIIHRVVKKWKDSYGYHFQTKGDHNAYSIKTPILDETNISEEQIIGNAVVRIPMLGYIKIWFVDLLNFLGLLKN